MPIRHSRPPARAIRPLRHSPLAASSPRASTCSSSTSAPSTSSSAPSESPSSREKEAAKATAKAKERPDAGSFTDVLKLYYPHFSQRTLDMMVSDAKEGIDAIDRRAFVQRAKGTYTDRLQMAFSKADKDDNGGLDVDEFVVAVRATGAQPPGRSKSHPISERELKELFADGDSDGNGIIDLNEFLELCAHHPWLVNAFDRVVEVGRAAQAQGGGAEADDNLQASGQPVVALRHLRVAFEAALPAGLV